MFKGAQEAMKNMGDNAMTTAAKYIDNYPIITGLALVAIATFSILSMSHCIEIPPNLSYTVLVLGGGVLCMRMLIVKYYAKGKSTYVHKTLKNSIFLVTVLGAALLAGGGLSLISSLMNGNTSFFDGASMSNIPIFGAVIGIGGLGAGILLNQIKNKTFRRIVPIVGVLGYMASIGWLMANFYIHDNPYSAGITSILLVFAAPLMQKAIITFNDEDNDQSVEMSTRHHQSRRLT